MSLAGAVSLVMFFGLLSWAYLQRAWFTGIDKAFSAGRVDQALFSYRRLLAWHHPGALGSYEKRCPIPGHQFCNMDLLLCLTEQYLRRGRPGEAARAYRHLALEFDAEGFPLKAIASWKALLELDPSRSEARKQLIRLYRRLGLHWEAKALENLASGDSLVARAAQQGDEADEA